MIRLPISLQYKYRSILYHFRDNWRRISWRWNPGYDSPHFPANLCTILYTSGLSCCRWQKGYSFHLHSELRNTVIRSVRWHAFKGTQGQRHCYQSKTRMRFPISLPIKLHASCMSSIVSYIRYNDLLVENLRFYPLRLVWSSRKGVPVTLDTKFGLKKLESLGYPTVKIAWSWQTRCNNLAFMPGRIQGRGRGRGMCPQVFFCKHNTTSSCTISQVYGDYGIKWLALL